MLGERRHMQNCQPNFLTKSFLMSGTYWGGVLGVRVPLLLEKNLYKLSNFSGWTPPPFETYYLDPPLDVPLSLIGKWLYYRDRTLKDTLPSHSGP